MDYISKLTFFLKIEIASYFDKYELNNYLSINKNFLKLRDRDELWKMLYDKLSNKTKCLKPKYLSYKDYYYRLYWTSGFLYIDNIKTLYNNIRSIYSANGNFYFIDIFDNLFFAKFNIGTKSFDIVQITSNVIDIDIDIDINNYICVLYSENICKIYSDIINDNNVIVTLNNIKKCELLECKKYPSYYYINTKNELLYKNAYCDNAYHIDCDIMDAHLIRCCETYILIGYIKDHKYYSIKLYNDTYKILNITNNTCKYINTKTISYVPERICLINGNIKCVGKLNHSSTDCIEMIDGIFHEVDLLFGTYKGQITNKIRKINNYYMTEDCRHMDINTIIMQILIPHKNVYYKIWILKQ